jgi:transcriptional regulator with XRE-family HTH domain
MTDIGPMLREARMHAGLDISEIEDRTKIRAKYLRALENEEWALLPGTAYTKGFLRSYADLLGLDGRLLVDEYKRQWEEPNELDLSPVRPTIGPDVREAGGPSRAGRWVAVLLTILVLAIALVLVGHLFGSSAPSRPGNAGSGLGSATSPANTAATGTTAHAASCAANGGGRLPRGCVSLRIVPSAAVAVCLVGDLRIRIDGRTVAARTRAYHARAFVVTLAHSTASLVVGGVPVTIAAAAGPVRYAVTAKHVRRIAAPRRFSCTA